MQVSVFFDEDSDALIIDMIAHGDLPQFDTLLWHPEVLGKSETKPEECFIVFALKSLLNLVEDWHLPPVRSLWGQFLLPLFFCYKERHLGPTRNGGVNPPSETNKKSALPELLARNVCVCSTEKNPQRLRFTYFPTKKQSEY